MKNKKAEKKVVDLDAVLEKVAKKLRPTADSTNPSTQTSGSATWVSCCCCGGGLE